MSISSTNAAAHTKGQSRRRISSANTETTLRTGMATSTAQAKPSTDPAELDKILFEGAERAGALAAPTLAAAYHAVGLTR